MIRKKLIYYFFCIITISTATSCVNNSKSMDTGLEFDLDSAFSEWEENTNSIIAQIHPFDSSFVYPPACEGVQQCDEKSYLKQEIFQTRENTMRSVLPFLINTTDSILVEENYLLNKKIINVYCYGKVYSYLIDRKTHLACKTSIKPASFAEAVNSVAKGYYYSADTTQISDLTCHTLITKLNDRLIFDVLALTINDIICDSANPSSVDK